MYFEKIVSAIRPEIDATGCQMRAVFPAKSGEVVITPKDSPNYLLLSLSAHDERKVRVVIWRNGKHVFRVAFVTHETLLKLLRAKAKSVRRDVANAKPKPIAKSSSRPINEPRIATQIQCEECGGAGRWYEGDARDKDRRLEVCQRCHGWGYLARPHTRFDR